MFLFVLLVLSESQFKMKYPIGIQIFSQIRENRSVFTDKTDFIYQLVSRGSIYFFSRPRRFSKSSMKGGER